MDISIKYMLLNKSDRSEVNDFMDFLLSKRKNSVKSHLSQYKKKILNVSVWNDTDLDFINDARKRINDWIISKW